MNRQNKPDIAIGSRGLRNLFRNRIAIASLLAIITAGAAATADVSETIRTIFIYGNKITREKTIRMFLSVHEGEPYDSARAAESEKHLMGSELFSKVDIVSNRTASGVNLYVIVAEKPYLTLSDIGGETYTMIYGRNVRWFWWRVRLGVAYTNFRGVMEELDARAAIWKGRAFSVSWKKPFLGTPYYLKLIAGIDYRPDLRMTFDRLSVYQATTLGRKTGKRSLLYGSLIPELEQKFWMGETGRLDIDSVCTTAVSCMPQSTWISYAPVIDDVEKRYTELYSVLGWITDGRDSRFDTRKGFFFAASLRTNALYPRRLDYTYAHLQSDTDTRLYHRGIFPGNTVAYRFRTTLRIDSAGSYDGLYAGGESTLRGYPLSFLPVTFVANNRILFAAEYRFPIFTTPAVTYPLLSQVHGGLKEFYYRLDGALVFDAGYLWHYLTEPLRSHDSHVYGTGAGVGLRIMAPTLSHSICADFAWGIDKARREYTRKYYRRPWQPEIYLYLDMYF